MSGASTTAGPPFPHDGEHVIESRWVCGPGTTDMSVNVQTVIDRAGFVHQRIAPVPKSLKLVGRR